MSLVKDARKEGTVKYERYKPEQTLLYQIIEKYYPQFLNHMGQQDKDLPKYVRSEFKEYLKCGRLEYGFLRVRCEDCHHKHLVAFSCKRRGFCLSCGARRMAESAALLFDDVLPHEPIRQRVLSFPFQLRFLFASYPHIMGKVLGIVYRTLATHITKKAGYNKQTAQTGAVKLIQNILSHLNTKNDEVVELLPPQSRAPTQISLFE
jgi:ribosomal protein S27E